MFGLHTEALCWLRFGKRMPIVCTEAGGWQADVLGMSKKVVYEIEIKKSISDLRADFSGKPHKHFVYGNAENFDARSRAGYVPNYFYFFLDQEIADKAAKIIDEKMPRAGLVVRSYPAESRYGLGGRNIVVRKRAQKLHSRPPSPGFMNAALMRMATEVCTARLMTDATQRDKAHRALNAVLTGIEGTVDFEDPVGTLEQRGAELLYVMERKVWGSVTDIERIHYMFRAQELLNLKRTNSEDIGEAPG